MRAGGARSTAGHVLRLMVCEPLKAWGYRPGLVGSWEGPVACCGCQLSVAGGTPPKPRLGRGMAPVAWQWMRLWRSGERGGGGGGRRGRALQVSPGGARGPAGAEPRSEGVERCEFGGAPVWYGMYCSRIAVVLRRCIRWRGDSSGQLPQLWVRSGFRRRVELPRGQFDKRDRRGGYS